MMEMDWIYGACDQVDRIVAQEQYYQELDTQRLELETAYERILKILSDEDREILTDYVYVISEMEYQKTQAAYRLGKLRGQMEIQGIGR